MAAHGDRLLQGALRDLASALTATGARWMVIGGIAVIARGARRFTADIDAAVRGDEVDVDTLLAVFAKKRIAPRIEHAARFARENLVLLLRHLPSGVEFDVSLAWTEFEHEAIAAATVAAFGPVKAPMARPEDLVVFKAICTRSSISHACESSPRWPTRLSSPAASNQRSSRDWPSVRPGARQSRPRRESAPSATADRLPGRASGRRAMA